MCVYIYRCVHVCLYTYRCVHVCLYIQVCACVSIYTGVCMCVYIYRVFAKECNDLISLLLRIEINKLLHFFKYVAVVRQIHYIISG